MISLSDIADLHPGCIQIGKLKFASYGQHSSIAGEIYTVACADDNSIVKSVLSREGGNKILVIDAVGVSHASMVGDQTGEAAVRNNKAGIVVNGYIRDVEALADLPIGIFEKGSVAHKTNKQGHGFEDVMVSIGGTVIDSSKWIYLDVNGWRVADQKLEL